MLKITCGILLLIFCIQAQTKGFGPGEQDFGYVTVREGCHMFWWLFHTSANVTNTSERPVILWLTGGPGDPSSGIGNFLGSGPLDLKMNLRNHTWVNDYNVLYVDIPVGTGYSYVESTLYLARSIKQVARDMVALMRGFYDKLPQFRNTPLYVHGDRYGSKIGAEFIRTLYNEVQNGSIVSNVKGLSMASSWISPVDILLSYSSYLYQMGLVDEKGVSTLDKQANLIAQRVQEGELFIAILDWFYFLLMIDQVTDGVDIGNVANKVTNVNGNKAFSDEYMMEQLARLMNGPVKEALNISEEIRWEWRSFVTFENLIPEFMLSSADIIEDILENTNLELHAISGNLNLLAATPGQLAWVNKLVWSQSDEFFNATRTTVWVDDIMEGYKKKGGRFSFHWINVAGFDFYNENAKATRQFLRSMTGF